MKTWLLCESCIHAESTSNFPRSELIKACSRCANACFAVVSRLVSEPDDVADLILNCVLQCRECANECEKYSLENDIEFCGDTCCMCADAVKDLAIFSLN